MITYSRMGRIAGKITQKYLYAGIISIIFVVKKYNMERSIEEIKIENLVKRVVKLEARIIKLEEEVKTKANKVVVYGK